MAVRTSLACMWIVLYLNSGLFWNPCLNGVPYFMWDYMWVFLKSKLGYPVFTQVEWHALTCSTQRGTLTQRTAHVFFAVKSRGIGGFRVCVYGPHLLLTLHLITLAMCCDNSSQHRPLLNTHLVFAIVMRESHSVDLNQLKQG